VSQNDTTHNGLIEAFFRTRSDIALRERGNDEAFRNHYNIVKTTSTEEAIIKKFESQGCFDNFTR